VTTRTVVTILMMWHVVVTSDMAMGGGIGWSSSVTWQWRWAWLLWFVKDGDVAVGSGAAMGERW